MFGGIPEVPAYLRQAVGAEPQAVSQVRTARSVSHRRGAPRIWPCHMPVAVPPQARASSALGRGRESWRSRTRLLLSHIAVQRSSCSCSPHMPAQSSPLPRDSLGGSTFGFLCKRWTEGFASGPPKKGHPSDQPEMGSQRWEAVGNLLVWLIFCAGGDSGGRAPIWPGSAAPVCDPRNLLQRQSRSKNTDMWSTSELGAPVFGTLFEQTMLHAGRPEVVMDRGGLSAQSENVKITETHILVSAQ